MTFSFTIYGRPITKKNSQNVVRGVPLQSRQYKTYESRFHRQIRDMQKKKQVPRIEGMVHVKALYWMNNRSGFPDLVGLMQATADLIADNKGKQWIIPNDRFIRSWDGTRIAGIDKENPRVEITIEPMPMNPNDADPEVQRILVRQGKLF